MMDPISDLICSSFFNQFPPQNVPSRFTAVHSFVWNIVWTAALAGYIFIMCITFNWQEGCA